MSTDCEEKTMIVQSSYDCEVSMMFWVGFNSARQRVVIEDTLCDGEDGRNTYG